MRNPSMLLLVALLAGSCQATPGTGTVAAEIDPRIWIIHQDRRGDYWFGSNGSGVYRYDGKRVVRYTSADGLGGDQIRDIEEDANGNLFISADEAVTKFDGTEFTTLELVEAPADGSAWVLDPDDVWIVCGPGRRGPCRYDGEHLYSMKLTASPVADAGSDTPGRRFTESGVYSIHRDRQGHLWFGTAGVGLCRFDGNDLAWMYEERLTTTPEGGAFGIRCVYQDDAGDYWICNTRQRFDIAAEAATRDGHRTLQYEKKPGLSESQADDDAHFAYFSSMTEDRAGALWLVSGTEGAWRYDGDTVTKFPIGVDAYAMTIYCDRDGTLWVGTLEQGIFTFDGTGDAFSAFRPAATER